MPLRTRRSFTRGTPRGLLGSIGLMAAHSWSVSSWRMIRSSPVWELESQACGPPQRVIAPNVKSALGVAQTRRRAASLIDPLKRSITVGTKAIVDAHHEAVDVLPDVDRKRRHAVGRRGEVHARCAEVKVVVFGEGGPVSRDRPLDTASGYPYSLGSVLVRTHL